MPLRQASQASHEVGYILFPGLSIPQSEMQSKRPATLGRRSGTTLLGPSTLLPSNVRHQSSCANDSTVNPQSLQRLQDLPVCEKRLIVCDWLRFRTLSSHSLLALSHVHASSNTLRTCHHGKRCKIATLNVGRISQLDTTGPFWAPVGRTVGFSFSQVIHIATTRGHVSHAPTSFTRPRTLSTSSINSLVAGFVDPRRGCQSS